MQKREELLWLRKNAPMLRRAHAIKSKRHTVPSRFASRELERGLQGPRCSHQVNETMSQFCAHGLRSSM